MFSLIKLTTMEGRRVQVRHTYSAATFNIIDKCVYIYEKHFDVCFCPFSLINCLISGVKSTASTSWSEGGEPGDSRCGSGVLVAWLPGSDTETCDNSRLPVASPCRCFVPAAVNGVTQVQLPGQRRPPPPQQVESPPTGSRSLSPRSLHDVVHHIENDQRRTREFSNMVASADVPD